jgi:hypothetical protein
MSVSRRTSVGRKQEESADDRAGARPGATVYYPRVGRLHAALAALLLLVGCVGDPVHGAVFDVPDNSSGHVVLLQGLSNKPGSTIEVFEFRHNGAMVRRASSTVSAADLVPNTDPPAYHWSVEAVFTRGVEDNKAWAPQGVAPFAVSENGQFVKLQMRDAHTAELRESAQVVGGLVDLPWQDFPNLQDPGLTIRGQASHHFLSARFTEDGQGTKYFEHVAYPFGTASPLGDRTTLNRFYQSTQRPDFPLTAAYYNDGDLGFGRRMECWVRENGGSVYCAVHNFQDVTKTPEQVAELARLADTSSSQRLFNSKGYVATVAMAWYSTPAGREKLMPVNFFIYAGQDGLPYSNRISLDGSSPAKEVPGICLNCHGGTHSEPARIQNSMFLPFDVASFRFPASTGLDAALQDSFQRLNLLVGLLTAYDGREAAVEVIEGWYEHSGGDIFTPGQTFWSGFVPQGWRGSAREQQLYLQVVAPYCRSCHMALDDVDGLGLTWSTAAEFKSFYDVGLIHARVCDHRGVKAMPHAQRTFQKFWTSGRSAFLTIDTAGTFGGPLKDCRYPGLPERP